MTTGHNPLSDYNRTEDGGFPPSPAGLVPAGAGRRMKVLGEWVTLKGIGDRRAWSLFEVETDTAAGPPPHRHVWDEAYYILDGSLAVLVGEEWLMAKPGDVVRIPGGVAHTYAARDGTARFLALVAPAGIETFFSELDHQASDEPPAIEAVLGVARRHGIEVRPPEA